MRGDDGAPGATSATAVLRERDFGVYFACAFISNAGTFMQSVGVPFVMYDLTHRNAWVGAAVFAVMVPALVLQPFAGALADRVSRKRILIGSSAVQGLSAALLWLLAARDALTPWRILAILCLGGVAAAFQNATAHALVSLLVRPEHLRAALRLNATSLNVARVLGPAAAGLVLDRWGYRATFAMNALSFAVVIAGLLAVRPKPQLRADHGSWVEAFVAGVRYARRHPALVQMMVASFVVSAFAMAGWQLGAGLVAEGYHADGTTLGVLIACFGGGATFAAVWMVARGDTLRRSTATTVAVLLYAAGIFVSVATSHVIVGVVGFVVMGMGHAACTIATNTALQSQVVESYRARVLSMFVMCNVAGTPIGALACGRLGDLIGLRPAIALFGLVVLGYGIYGVVALQRFAGFDAEVDPVSGAVLQI